jgi:hypothetical protein
MIVRIQISTQNGEKFFYNGRSHCVTIERPAGRNQLLDYFGICWTKIVELFPLRSAEQLSMEAAVT